MKPVPQTRRARLGQNFLADSRYRRRIADSLGVRPDDLVIEIGPGRGAMTPLLAERARRVLGIELDRKLAAGLQQTFAGNSRIETLQSDVLRADLRALCRERGAAQCFLFGNLPYYITSPILHHAMQFADSIRGMAFVVQREVADRITASPGSRDYGYLTVFVQNFARPRLMFHIPPGAFSPRPKVDSSLVLFEMRAEGASLPRAAHPSPTFQSARPDEDYAGAPSRSAHDSRGKARPEDFLEFVKRCFAQRRKKLVNNLAPAISRQAAESALAALSISPSARAEDLSLEQFRALFDRL